jgi:hypothetical protein
MGLVILLVACTTLFPTSVATPSPVWQAKLDDLARLLQDLEFPAHFEEEDARRTGEEFDVNDYFTVLTHLSPEPGYVLDYVYYYDFMGGEPVIYARQQQEESYTTSAEYSEALGGNIFGDARYEFLDHVEIDGTAEGFFEYVVLMIQGGQFYLVWHANYNDITVVCSHEAVERVIEAANDFGTPLTSAQEREAMSLDLEPRVDFEEDTVRVRVVTFSKWGGFIENVFTISRDFPHRLLDYEGEELVPYDCGVMF